MISVLGLLLLLPLTIFVIPQIYAAEARDGLKALLLPLSLIVVTYLLYEIAIWVWLGGLLAANSTPPRVFRYGNVAIEISLPTCALLVAGLSSDPLSILSGAIPFIYFLLVVLVALNLDFTLCVFAGAVACVEFLTTSLYLVEESALPLSTGIPVVSMLTSPHQYMFKSTLLLACGLIAGFVAVQMRRQLTHVVRTLEERDRAVSIFGQHVSPQVADLLLKQPVDFTGQEQNVCVMFVDIRDFSKFSSEHSATEVVEYLNQLFGPLIPIVNRHAGVVNKFLGDGFMAVFGAPVNDDQQCRHAIQAAREILGEVERLNSEVRIPPTRLGIGLHFGRAVTGNVGTSERKEYTIIGDVVNLASRIEQANKPLGSQLLVSEVVANIVGGGGFDGTDMGLVELKGQPHPVRLFKIA
jgi:adenylate cyclase